MPRINPWFSRLIAAAPLTAAVAFGLAQPAAAYVGPGAGLTAIGSVLALLAFVVLALVGFVWYPVKRLMKRRTATPATSETTVGEPK